MTPRLPSCTDAQVMAALKRGGWYIHETRGSHHQLRHPDKPGLKVTIPVHNRELQRWLLTAIIKQAGLSQDEFRELL